MAGEHRQVYAVRAERTNYDEEVGELIAKVASHDLANFPPTREWKKDILLNFPEWEDSPCEYWEVKRFTSGGDDFFNAQVKYILIHCTPFVPQEEVIEDPTVDLLKQLNDATTQMTVQLENITLLLMRIIQK